MERIPEKERADRSFDFLFEVVRGWQDVVDAGGEAVPFSRDVFAVQLNRLWFRTGILAAYDRGDDRPRGPPGKLRQAARALAYLWTGRADPERVAGLDPETKAHFSRLGVPDDQMPGGELPADTAIEVWDDHRHAFAVFRASGTQWRFIATQRALFHHGLDYPGVEVVMRRLLPPEADASAVFADIMVMEAEALPILNEVTA